MTMTTPLTPDSSSMSLSVPGQASRLHSRREAKFVAWVERLCADDPGARKALRTGLRKNLDEVPQMHRFVAAWLPSDRTPQDTQRAYYTVAALIAAQPRTALADPDPHSDGQDDQTDGAGPSDVPSQAATAYGSSLGTAFARAVVHSPGRDKAMREATAESRLHQLTRQSLPGLHRHLPAAVAYVRACDVPVDWAQLLGDLTHWRQYSGGISRRWLQDYYRLRAKDAREAAARSDEEAAVHSPPADVDPQP
ncbi:type I-E CRISPR-associated protein Cse2/CasB [Streptomyces sp. NPDC048659]|uniref:type I-E CRISPR-associated protein Cse2/CasB n=1 Tax=Streptomyces sp. NPDC048659 TaxID=3155489 RepID=UPI00344A1282